MAEKPVKARADHMERRESSRDWAGWRCFSRYPPQMLPSWGKATKAESQEAVFQ
jgi:hypothetical protein